MRLAFQPHYWVICLYPLLSCSEKPVLSWHVIKKCKTEQLCMTLYDSGFLASIPRVLCWRRLEVCQKFVVLVDLLSGDVHSGDLYVKCCWMWYVTASNICGTLAIFLWNGPISSEDSNYGTWLETQRTNEKCSSR